MYCTYRCNFAENNKSKDILFTLKYFKQVIPTIHNHIQDGLSVHHMQPVS